MTNKLKKKFRLLYVPVANWYYKHFQAPRRYHYLYDAIAERKASNILEIGVWNGKRAVKMIDIAKENNAETPKYFGFDLFENLGEDGYQTELSKRPPIESEVRQLLASTRADIHLYCGNTLETLPEAVPTLPTMDFIFIDGGHSNETVASDWNHIRSLMDENTIVIFDDYWRNRIDGGAKKTVDAIDVEKYNVEILHEIDKFNNSDFGYLEISFAKITKRK